MWKPLRRKILGQQSHLSRVLLANHIKRLYGLDQEQRQVSVQRYCSTTAGEKHDLISSPWPFLQWEIDIVVPFSLRKGQIKFLVVVIDHFNKWVEAQPLAHITEE